MTKTNNRQLAAAAKRMKCAIYTRKSTEDGLEQEFNSLDAQRESGEAYNGTKRYRYYVCTKAQKRGWHNCPSKSIPATEIERFVADQIKAVGHDPAFLSEVVAQAHTQTQSHLAQLEAEQRGLERELGQWTAEVRKLVAQIRPDDNDSPAIARMADLQDRMRGAERRATEVREQTVAWLAPWRMTCARGRPRGHSADIPF